jgi:hypothetical protein
MAATKPTPSIHRPPPVAPPGEAEHFVDELVVAVPVPLHSLPLHDDDPVTLIFTESTPFRASMH